MTTRLDDSTRAPLPTGTTAGTPEPATAGTGGVDAIAGEARPDVGSATFERGRPKTLPPKLTSGAAAVTTQGALAPSESGTHARRVTGKHAAATVSRSADDILKPTQVLGDLNRATRNALARGRERAQATGARGDRELARLRRADDALSRALSPVLTRGSISDLGELQTARTALEEFAREVATLRLDDGQTWQALGEARDGLFAAAAKGYGLHLEPVAKAPGLFDGERRLNGLLVTPASGKTLTSEQVAAATQLRGLAYELEHLRFETHAFGAGAIALDANGLGVGNLYDTLLRAGFGVPTGAAEPSVAAPAGGREIQYLGGVLDQVDQALHGRAVSFAPPLTTLGGDTIGSMPAVTAPTLPDVRGTRLPQAGTTGRVDLSGGTSELMRLNLATRQLAGNAPYDLARGGSSFFSTYTPAATGVRDALSPLLGFQYAISAGDVALLNSAVQQALVRLPGGYGALVGQALTPVLGQVTPGTTLATATSYTLASPQVLHQDGSDILLGAGTRISKESGAIVIAGPDTRVGYGTGQTVVASDSVIKLGQDVDLIDVGALHVAGADSTTDLTAAHFEVNRGAQTAVIRADHAVFDYTKGGGSVTELTGVRLEQVGDTRTAIGADQVRWAGGSDRVTASAVELANTRSATGSSLAVGGSAIDGQLGVTAIRADSLHIQLTETTGTHPSQQLEMTARGLTLGEGDQRLTIAGDARVAQTLTADGTRLDIRTDQTTLDLGAGRFQAGGPLTLIALSGPTGALQRVDVAGSQLAYTDGHGTSLTSGRSSLTAIYGPGGALDRIAGTVGDTHVVSNGQRVDLTGTGELGVRLAPDGTLRQLTGQVATGELTFADATRRGSIGAGTAVTLDCDPRGQLQQLLLTNGSGTFSDASGRWSLNGSEGLVRWDDQGRLSSASVSAGSVKGTLASGAAVDGTGTRIALTATDGLLQHGELEAATLTHHDPSGAVTDLKEARAGLDFNTDGTLRHAGASLGSGSFASGGDRFSGTGLSLDVLGANGRPTSLAFTGATLGLTTKSGALDLSGARLNASFDPQGALRLADFNAATLRYNGNATNGQPLGVDITGGLRAGLTVGADGSQTLSFNAADGRLSSGGNSLRFENIDRLQLTTDPTGRVQGLDFGSKGLLSLERSDASGNVRDLQLSLKPGASITGSFSEASLDLRGQGLRAQLRGAQFGSTRTETWLHLDGAELEKLNLAEKLKIDGKVEALDLRVDQATGDRLKSLDLQLQNLELTGFKDANLTIHSPTSGDRFRLHLGMDEQGKELRELFLKIPAGGEVRVVKGDLTATLGPQQLGVYYDPPATGQGQGRLRLMGEGVNADITADKTHVKIGGVNAEVWLDPAKGLVIQQLSGKIDVDKGGQKVAISIGDIHNLSVKMAEYSGDTRGFALVLEPAHEGSANLTASVRSGGYGLEFSNLGALAAYGTIGKNQATLSVGDPTGRGRVKATVGPVTLEGSRIGLFAQFYAPTADKVLRETTRHVRSMVSALEPSPTDRARILPGLYLTESTLEIGRLTKGFDANLVLRLPDSVYATPSLQWSGRQEQDRSAWGLEGTVGYIGEKRMLTITAGLEPYSSLDVRALGDLELKGHSLPTHVNLPTAADASITYGQKQENGLSWAASVGGYVSASGWDANGVKAPVQGVHAEVAVRKNTGKAELEGVFGVTEMRSGDLRDRGVFLGFRVRW